MAECFAEIIALYDSGKITPAAATVFTLDEAGKALAAVRDHQIDGRAVLHPRDA